MSYRSILRISKVLSLRAFRKGLWITFCSAYVFLISRYFEIIFVTNISSFISEIGGSSSKKVREHCSLCVYPFEGFANVLVNEV